MRRTLATATRPFRFPDPPHVGRAAGACRGLRAPARPLGRSTRGVARPRRNRGRDRAWRAAQGRALTRISVGIVCRNEARKLRECLESVTWADEVIVMDLESSDGSAELAEQHGAQVLRRQPVPIVELVRNEVGDAASGEWMLVLDP